MILRRTAKTAARTAVIAGTATHVSGKVAARQAAPGAPAAPAPAPAAAPEPSGLSAEAIGQLKSIAELHASGVLTDEEFATQKAKILG